MSERARPRAVGVARRRRRANERRRVLASGVASHACATALLVGACHLTSALAPPARIAVLSDKTLWSHRPSRYLEDVAMYIKQK